MIAVLSREEHLRLVRESARFQHLRQCPQVLALFDAVTGHQFERAIDDAIKAKHEAPYEYLKQPDDE